MPENRHKISGHSYVVIGMLLLALGSTVLIIKRMLERSHDPTFASSVQLPMTLETARLERSRGDPAVAAKSRQQATSSIHRLTPRSQKRGSNSQQAGSTVSIKNGRLSIEAHAVSLDTLLAEVSRKSGLEIFYDEASEESVSIAFQELRLDDGLRKILENYDIFFLYGATGEEPTALWVYPRGWGRDIVPAPPESWASTSELEQEFSSSSDAVERMRALETVIARKGKRSVDLVLYTLSDTNGQVRYSALSGALDNGVRLPEGTLENAARYDRSPFVRSLALKAIGEGSGVAEEVVRSIAHAALADPHGDVQMQARDVLATLRQPIRAERYSRRLRHELLKRQTP